MIHQTMRAGFLAGALATIALGLSTGVHAQSVGKFILDPMGTGKARLGYYPVKVDLTTTKPDGITKEPAYRATPKYGVIHVGNGPKSTFCFAVDEPKDADWKIYLDKNGNGDLTDDGDGAWAKKSEGSGRVQYGVNTYTLRASWGTAKREIVWRVCCLSLSILQYGQSFYVSQCRSRRDAEGGGEST